ncbi:DUF3073 domain-containing protein [Catenulispora subtropica]|uniref:DUF3073 domain-containing protein n=1 Tax=Catenulispora subtropica TaxID=450798 RepID=A0ABN2R7V0_9ACTN
MGRGRAKAKATKVARELKYTSPGGDLARLQAELRAARGTEDPAYPPGAQQDEDLDDQ